MQKSCKVDSPTANRMPFIFHPNREKLWVSSFEAFFPGLWQVWLGIMVKKAWLWVILNLLLKSLGLDFYIDQWSCFCFCFCFFVFSTAWDKIWSPKNKNNTVEKRMGESLQLQCISCLNKNSDSRSGGSRGGITTCGVFSNEPPSGWQLLV